MFCLARRAHRWRLSTTELVWPLAVAQLCTIAAPAASRGVDCDLSCDWRNRLNLHEDGHRTTECSCPGNRPSYCILRRAYCSPVHHRVFLGPISAEDDRKSRLCSCTMYTLGHCCGRNLVRIRCQRHPRKKLLLDGISCIHAIKFLANNASLWTASTMPIDRAADGGRKAHRRGQAATSAGATSRFGIAY